MFSYLLPTITPLPRGYECSIIIPIKLVTNLFLKEERCKVNFNFKVYGNGKLIDEQNILKILSKNEDYSNICFKTTINKNNLNCHCYSELNIDSPEKIGLFSKREMISYYPFHHDKNKKTFFSDVSYKYGSPTIIFDMSHFKKYVETYSVFHIDKQRDLGESLLFTNPYDKKILIKFKTSDSREIKPLIINPKHAIDLDLKCILNDEEKEWKGHIQLWANNRVGMFNFKHSLQDPTLISDLEHLDPYRAEQTHLRFFQILRSQLGNKINLIKNTLNAKRY